MLSLKLIHVILVLVYIQISSSERRIKDGVMYENSKRYMVYLIKDNSSRQEYDEWICGGAIVTERHIVTSAACVTDVDHIYAIAGYKKYVRSDQLGEDECTKALRKKVISTCVPKRYEFDYGVKWAFIDIAVVQVESPYNFNAPLQPGCSWVPDKIQINYENKRQEPGVDAVVLGWGHKQKWRKPEDSTDYNEKILHWGSTLIQNKEVCKKAYNSSALSELRRNIDKYMICTFETGNLDADGDIIRNSDTNVDGCALRKRTGRVPGSCEDKSGTDFIDGTRRDMSESNATIIYNITRRNGICQNDHGGPLITWVGSHEALIGVASVFLVGKDNECIGPYLFTSTQCNGAFLSCVLAPPESLRDGHSRKINICNKPAAERGFSIVRRRISWINHPDGPAVNEFAEDIFPRPQIPLKYYGK